MEKSKGNKLEMKKDPSPHKKCWGGWKFRLGLWQKRNPATGLKQNLLILIRYKYRVYLNQNRIPLETIRLWQRGLKKKIKVSSVHMNQAHSIHRPFAAICWHLSSLQIHLSCIIPICYKCAVKQCNKISSKLRHC